MKKPIERTKIRRILGKEYYIIKRKFSWITSNTNWAQIRHNLSFDNEVFFHHSLILRPLKHVDMYLQHNKRKNLEIAVGRINNVVIQPGELFSFWKLVGRPSNRKGYLEGLVLNQGKIDKGTGGGLCQLGNLLFWLVAHSPLDITERYRHSFDVFPDVNRRVPFGAGATLSYNYIDFQFKNNTSNRFQLELWLDNKYLYGKLKSELETLSKFKIVEKNHLITPETWGGYTRHNQIIKQEIVDQEVIDEKLLVENHAIMMYNPLLEK